MTKAKRWAQTLLDLVSSRAVATAAACFYSKKERTWQSESGFAEPGRRRRRCDGQLSSTQNACSDYNHYKTLMLEVVIWI